MGGARAEFGARRMHTMVYRAPQWGQKVVLWSNQWASKPALWVALSGIPVHAPADWRDSPTYLTAVRQASDSTSRWKPLRLATRILTLA